MKMIKAMFGISTNRIPYSSLHPKKVSKIKPWGNSELDTLSKWCDNLSNKEVLEVYNKISPRVERLKYAMR